MSVKSAASVAQFLLSRHIKMTQAGPRAALTAVNKLTKVTKGGVVLARSSRTLHPPSPLTVL